MNRGPHVRELFIGHQAAFEYDEKESKKSYSVTKKNKSGGSQLPKLGAYKPKILSDDSTSNIPLEPSRVPERSNTPQPPQEGKVNKAFVIGDKDVPMFLEPPENIYSEIQDTGATSSDSDQTTSNPIFTGTSPVQSPTTHQGNVYRDNYTRSRSVAHDTIPEEINGVTLPPPDYDENEMTMDFDGENVSGGRNNVYREFAGEDFAQYLSDDEEDYEFDRPSYTVRSKPLVSRKAFLQKDKKAKTEAWRGDKPKRDSTKSLFNKNAKNSGKTTLRHFSVDDTKLGIGMDGSSKAPKPSLRDGVPFEASYESFLQARNGGPRWGSLESASSDSGHETGDDVIRAIHEKSSPFWKKLTIKIKKAGYGIKH